MKTLILSMSPRRSFSASMYYSKLLKLGIKNHEVELLELKTPRQYSVVEKQLSEVDNIVFVTPVYVDTIPSTVLDKLVKIENYVQDKDIKLNIYALTNCGFYEGEQCDLAQKTFKIWSKRCGFEFKGGLGIGAGVMLAFIRTLIPIGIIITLFEFLFFAIYALITTGTITFNDVIHTPMTLIVQTALYFLWSTGLFINLFKMAKKIEKQSKMGIVYTTLWFCPRFLFVIIASIYWIIASIFWYRGNFLKLLKEPE